MFDGVADVFWITVCGVSGSVGIGFWIVFVNVFVLPSSASV